MILNMNQLIIPFLEYIADYYSKCSIKYYRDTMSNKYYIFISDDIFNDDVFIYNKLKLLADISKIFKTSTIYISSEGKKNIDTSLFEIEYEFKN